MDLGQKHKKISVGIVFQEYRERLHLEIGIYLYVWFRKLAPVQA